MTKNVLLRFHAIRRERGLNQQGMAALIDVPQCVLSRWENGRGEPSIRRLFEVAARLNIRPGDLLADTAEGEK